MIDCTNTGETALRNRGDRSQFSLRTHNIANNVDLLIPQYSGFSSGMARYHIVETLIVRVWNRKSIQKITSNLTSKDAYAQVHYSDAIMGTIVSQITNLTIVYSTVYSGVD